MLESRSLQDDQFFRNKASLKLIIFFGLIFTGLIIRLFYLQIYHYNYHLRLSEKNRVRLKIIEAPRGLILDREENVIARNRPSYQVSIHPINLTNTSDVVNNLMKIKDTAGTLIFDSLTVRKAIQTGRWRKFEHLSILEDAPIEVVSIIEEHQLDLPGVATVVQSRREYPFGTLASHTLGYTSAIQEGEFKHYQEKGYRKGNRVGTKGLEKQYENVLRGREGKIFYEVNVYGKELGVLDEMSNEPAKSGYNLLTTLNLGLQQVAERAFADSLRGSVVAIDPRNGDILAMLSSPRINGNIFSLSKSHRNKAWNVLAFDSNRPLNNRAVIGIYDPGSTFKAVVSLAGMITGKLSPDYSGFKGCNGGYKFGKRYQRCWKPSGHGRTDFYLAFRQSCDTYYYQAGLLIGMDAINEVAAKFGFGTKTGVDLVSERSGLLMDSATYNKKFKSRGWKWSRGIILNLAIGQGQLVTPLQLANYAAGLGNGRELYKPHLLKEIQDSDGRVVTRYEPEVLNNIALLQEHHEAVLEAMRQVVEEPHGTGRRVRVEGVVVGGKSGSAENPFGDKTHALFIAVAPLYNPEIAIGVIVENAGHGGSVAAPIAGKMLKYYFHGTTNGNKS